VLHPISRILFALFGNRKNILFGNSLLSILPFVGFMQAFRKVNSSSLAAENGIKRRQCLRSSALLLIYVLSTVAISASELGAEKQ